ncbi:MAG: amidohydrolase family protein [Pseudomonadota bacterium]
MRIPSLFFTVVALALAPAVADAHGDALPKGDSSAEKRSDGSQWFINGRVYTPTRNGFMAYGAFAVGSDGRITHVRTVAPELDDATPVVDLRGKTVIPGLIDAHAHLLSEARLQQEVDLVGAASLDESLARISEFLEDPDHREGWVLGRGWNQVLWPGRAFPTANALDRVEADRPVYLRRIDGHAAWANSAALALAGIDADTPDPTGGRILRDGEGNATGVLVDAAMELVTQHIPDAARAPSERAVRDTVARLNREGLTGVHQAGLTIAEARRLDELYARGGLPLRLYLMLAAGEDLAAFGDPWIDRHNGRLTLRAVKLYADGALGSRGAALLKPYTDEPDSIGLLFQQDNALTAAVRTVHDAGFQVGIHAIGDAANRQALDAIERVQGQDASRRHRIEHAQILSPSDLPRFAELGVIASMQPTHATSDMNMAEDRLGAGRIVGAYAWRSLLDQGTVIAAGSDFPVELSNPFHGLHAAIARKDANGMPKDGWYANEAMTRPEALTAYTLAAAYAAHQEGDVGSLEPGKWADFLVLDRNIMRVPAADIRNTQVKETWIAGARVYRASEPTR